MRMLANRVRVIIDPELDGQPHQRATLTIAKDGHIDIHTPALVRNKRTMFREVLVEYLDEVGFAEMKPVGPEDRELFLTDRGMEFLKEELNNLTSWRTWDNNV